MQAIDINDILNKKFTDYLNSKPLLVKKLLIKLLKKVLYIDKVNMLMEKFGHLNTKPIIMELFDYLNFSFIISNKDLQKIPSEGRVIIAANHPIGSLDSLALLKAVLDIRNDVLIVANDILGSLGFLKEHIIPFNLFHSKIQRNNLNAISLALKEEKAVIIFPAAEVSRLKYFRVQDSKWKKGAVYYAQKHKAPILPVYIEAKNSFLFYFVSMISKKLSTFLLPHELFNKRNKTIRIIIGNIIPAKAFATSNINLNYQTKMLKKHVYRLKKKKGNIFITEKSIIHPIAKKIIKKEVDAAEFLGKTKDNKRIILTTLKQSPNLLTEIARLRELTFRKVGEGTGNMLDIDKYDEHYFHLIVWDDIELEIVGAYRIGLGETLLKKNGIKGFYTSSLFNFTPHFIEKILPNSIELGRSFVQEKYWNTYALDYLWQGIGTYLSKNSNIKYLFGGVSLSSKYSQEIISLIVFYFNKWFSTDENFSYAKNKFIIDKKLIDDYNKIFGGTGVKEDLKNLKKILHQYGYSIPVLYKHYVELCDEGGVSFLDFGIDPDFNNCIDGLILLDVTKIKEEKRKRYFTNENGVLTAKAV